MAPSSAMVWIVLAVLVAVEIAILVPVVVTQKRNDEAAGATRVTAFSELFERRALRVINQVAYSVRRTAAGSLLGKNGTRNYMTQFQFHEFTQVEAAPYVSISTIYIWVPIISREERQAYEDFYGFPIYGFNQFFNGTAPASERDVYAPITLLEPPSPGSPLIGLDLFGPGVYSAIGVLIRNQTISYLVQSHATLAGKGPDRWGIFFGGFNPHANAYALGRLEVEGIINEAVAVPRDQVVVGAWGDFPNEAQQLLYKDNSTLLENVTSIRMFNESHYRDQFQTVVVDVFGDKILFAIAYSSSVYDTYAGTSWVTLAVILSCVCVVANVGVVVLMLAWRHRVMLHRWEQERHAKTQQMMGYVSHEIRNPLQTIIGMAELELDDEEHRHASSWNAVLQSADAIECIANDVLDVRRIEEGRLECSFSIVNVEQLFKDLSVAVRPLLRDGVVFSSMIDVTLSAVAVCSDVRRLRQILLNFLTNAAKFTDHGMVTLEFLVHSATMARFSVCDTGRGIPEDKQQALFRQFQQVEATDAQNGFGLGLYLCCMLARVLGVELGFSSEAGVGTVFWLNVPLDSPHVLWSDFEKSIELIPKAVIP